MEKAMYEVCGACGKMYGKHLGEWCYAFGQGGSVFTPTGRYRATAEEERPMKCRFKEGTVLQDLINATPGWNAFKELLDKTGIGLVDRNSPLNITPWNRAINSNPDWQTFCLKHGLLEEIEQPLSFKVEVDGKVVWEGEGQQLHIAENGWWVLELTKKGYRYIDFVRGPLGGTNIANDGKQIIGRE